MTGGNLGHNLANLGFEPHVQHTVRLIHDQVGHLAQIDFSCLQKVIHAPWSGNHNVCPSLDVTQLGTFRSPSIHTLQGWKQSKIDITSAPQVKEGTSVWGAAISSHGE